MKRNNMYRLLAVLLSAVVLTASLAACGGNEPPVESATETQNATISTEAAATESPSAVEPSVQTPEEIPSTEPTTAAQTTPETTTPPPVTEKKGDLYKVVGSDKIWANIMGEAYLLFKNTDEPTEYGNTGKVYELYVLVAQTGDDYTLWGDGHWDLNVAGDTLTLSPINQSENGNIGVAAGESKTYKKSGNVFQIDMSFSAGGDVRFEFDPSADALQ